MHPIYFYPAWRGLFWLSYLAWAALEIWVFARDRKIAQGEKKDRGSIFALIAIIIAGVGLMFNAPYFAPWLRFSAQPQAWIFAGAILFIWCGMLFRLWAIQTLGRFFRTTVFVQDDHVLVTWGPYRLLRHPAYTGGSLTMLGIGLAQGNFLSLGAGLLCGPLAYFWRMRVEEQALQGRFGKEFTEQRGRTWAIIPFLW